MAKLHLTRELCALVERQVTDPGPGPGIAYLSDEEFGASINETLAAAPDPGDLWVFAYGSLIWKPGFHYLEQRTGIIRGWHRAFCLRSARWRGTPDCPGLIMALERGGQCRGVVYRLDPVTLQEDLRQLWRRELGPKPANQDIRWVMVNTEAGPVRAIAFTANRGGVSYMGGLSLEETAAMVARAAGVWGSCAAYLRDTVSALENLGIRDRGLWRLQQRVAREILAIHRMKQVTRDKDIDLQRRRQPLCPQSPDRAPGAGPRL